MSLSPPEHDVSRPGVFCWEDNAISLMACASLLLGLLSIASLAGSGWHAHLCQALLSLLAPHTSVRHFPGAQPDGTLPLFFLQVETYIYTVKFKECECCGAQGLKGSKYSWLLSLCHPNTHSLILLY